MALNRKTRKHDAFPRKTGDAESSPYTGTVIDRILRVVERDKVNRKIVMSIFEANQIVEREYSIQEALKIRLDGALRYAAFSRSLRLRERSKTELIKMFSQTEKAARNLLRTLQVSEATDGAPIPAWLNHGGLHLQAAKDPISAARVVSNTPKGTMPTLTGKMLIRDAVSSVEDLERWARLARETLELPPNPDQSSEEHKPNQPKDQFREWQIEIAQIWRDVFGRTDIDSREFGNFIAEAAAPLGEELSEDVGRKLAVLREGP